MQKFKELLETFIPIGPVDIQEQEHYKKISLIVAGNSMTIYCQYLGTPPYIVVPTVEVLLMLRMRCQGGLASTDPDLSKIIQNEIIDWIS